MLGKGGALVFYKQLYLWIIGKRDTTLHLEWDEFQSQIRHIESPEKCLCIGQWTQSCNIINLRCTYVHDRSYNSVHAYTNVYYNLLNISFSRDSGVVAIPDILPCIGGGGGIRSNGGGAGSVTILTNSLPSFFCVGWPLPSRAGQGNIRIAATPALNPVLECSQVAIKSMQSNISHCHTILFLIQGLWGIWFSKVWVTVKWLSQF